jgi:hypothetical protein
MLLLSKPATGYSLHRKKKGPQKKLFDYLPKGRRLIVKDPTTGGYKALIPISHVY